ncbi:PTS system mannose-specific eiibca component [Bacillus cereus VD045]|nr:PTS system mannose-specific eiibca component [Bacillus cereus VD045]
MPIIIIPVFTSLIVDLAFVFIIGAPVAQVFVSLTARLAGMQGSSSILLALILGAMISFDMGGPVNRVAFLFGSEMIGEGNYEIMGPIAAAICIPPIGMGLLPSVRENSKIQREKWVKHHSQWGYLVLWKARSPLQHKIHSGLFQV